MGLAYLKATGGFLKSFFRPRERVIAVSENGHRVLEGWAICPEERVVEMAVRQATHKKSEAHTALFCFAGPHRGEVIWLKQKAELLGPGADCTVVITASENCPNSDARYRAIRNGQVNFMGEGGSLFHINGVEESRTELFDYDEVSFLGNQFLVLDTGGQRGV